MLASTMPAVGAHSSSRCLPAQVMAGPWLSGSRRKAVVHRVVRCWIQTGRNANRHRAWPLGVMHVGSFDTNVGDNVALDHVQHHLASALLPYHGATEVDFHLLDLLPTFVTGGNSEDFAVDVFVRLRHELNVSLLAFGGGGLVQPMRQTSGTGWRLPLNQHVIDRLQGLPYMAYGVGVNLFRKPVIGPRVVLNVNTFSETERLSIRATILNALSFSVRNDGSYKEMLSLFPDDAEVRAKLWEVADPGMILPAARLELVRKDSVRPHVQPTPSLPVGRVAMQLAWNADRSINTGRLGKSGVVALARFAATTCAVFLPHTPAKDFTLQALLKQTAKRLGFKSGNFGANVVQPAWFQSHLAFDQHTTLLTGLYNSSWDSTSYFDAVVAMRGHGLYLCVALNIPCIALSTQDKVTGFARICGLDDYLVDVAEDGKWAQPPARNAASFAEQHAVPLRVAQEAGCVLEPLGCRGATLPLRVANALQRAAYGSQRPLARTAIVGIAAPSACMRL